MKKIFAIALISSVFFASCEKTNEQPADWSSVAVIHTAPGTDTLNVFVDTMKFNSSGITYGASSTYLPVLAGQHTYNIRTQRLPTTARPEYVNSFSYTTERGKAYSFFVYDTVSTTGGMAKVLRLTDDLTLPTAPNTHIRFLHLAPNAPAVDVTLVRTSATPVDSVTISNRSYIGATPNEASLSAFQPVPGGTYTARVKLAGTQTLVQTVGLGATLSTGRIVTLFATGTARGRALSIGAFRHY